MAKDVTTKTISYCFQTSHSHTD